jgi:hypothetical protein
MSYHLTLYDIDPTKMIHVHTLWTVLQSQYTDNGHHNTSTIKTDVPVKLLSILDTYRNKKIPAMHMYTGMFDTHMVFSQEVGVFLQDQIISTYPVRVSIDALDSVVLLYSIVLLCYAALFFSLLHKMTTDQGPVGDEVVTVKHLQEDLLFYDIMYWCILIAVIYMAIDMCMPVSNPYLNIWWSCAYVIFLSNACNIAEIGKHTRFSTLFAWVVHAVMLSACSNASMFDGACLVLIHVISFLFFYVNIIEEKTLYTKFIHIRFWSVIACNFFILCMFTINTQYISPRTHIGESS